MPAERKATASKTKAIAQLPGVLTYTQDDFEEDLSNLVYDAWRFRGSEHHLYPLYNHILSLSCWNLRHPNQPRTTLVTCPQPLFGDCPDAKPEASAAETKDAHKAKGASQAKGVSQTKGKSKAKEEPQKEPRSLKQIPDFARVLVFGDDGGLLEGTGLSSIRELVEFCELKALNSPHRWWTKGAERDALLESEVHLLQLYNAAMAGFAHNPDWKQVYAILIVGAYFTQVVWTARPPDKALKPLAHARVPKTIQPDRVYGNVINTLLRQVPNFEARVAPECFFHNAPVFAYDHDREDPNHPRVSLSSKFLFALDRPIRNLYPQMSPRSSLFEAVSRFRVTRGLQTNFRGVFERTLINDPVSRAREQAQALGYRSAEDTKAATPTPPNSVAEVRFKGSVKNVKSLPKSHIVTRKQSLANLPAIHDAVADDDSSGAEDSAPEDEGDE